MEIVSHQVSSSMYAGIMAQIESCVSADKNGYWGDYYSYLYLNIPVSIEWYDKHCVVSSLYIRKEYEKLAEQIKDKYFIYNYITHHRYTLVSQLIGDAYTESHNQLIPSADLREEDIVVGKTTKVNGLYIRIIEVYEDIEAKDKYGKFKARTLIVEELIKMRKGEH